MKYYNLIHRIEILENYILEGKRDQEILNNFLGDEYYAKYNAIKNKIKDPEYKDIYSIINKNKRDVKKFIDTFQSNSDVRRSKKAEGSKLVYDKDNYKIYRITTPEAAQLYGANTKWCISGRLSNDEDSDDIDEKESRGFFKQYIKGSDTEKAYYFVITPRNRKYCITRSIYGDILHVWNEFDDIVDTKKFLSIHPIVGKFFNSTDDTQTDHKSSRRGSDFSETIFYIDNQNPAKLNELISQGADPNCKPNGYTLLQQLSMYNKLSSDELEMAQILIDSGCDVNARDNRTGDTALITGVNNIQFAKLLLNNGADPNATNNNGDTPLSKCKKATIRKLLIANGARE